jgi:hypothetical protein
MQVIDPIVRAKRTFRLNVRGFIDAVVDLAEHGVCTPEEALTNIRTEVDDIRDALDGKVDLGFADGRARGACLYIQDMGAATVVAAKSDCEKVVVRLPVSVCFDYRADATASSSIIFSGAANLLTHSDACSGEGIVFDPRCDFYSRFASRLHIPTPSELGFEDF